MSKIIGLEKILQKRKEQQAARTEDRKSTKGRWLSPNDGQTIFLRALQEFDEDAPGYNEDAGVAPVLVVHESPSDFKRKCLCLMDADGTCVACEHGVKQKTELYMQYVLTDKNGKPLGDNEDAVKIWARNINHVVSSALFDAAEAKGTVLRQTFKLTREGTGFNNTKYTFSMVDIDDVLDVTPFVDHMLDVDRDVIANVSNEQMAKFLKLGESDDSDEPPAPGEGVSDDDEPVKTEDGAIW